MEPAAFSFARSLTLWYCLERTARSCRSPGQPLCGDDVPRRGAGLHLWPWRTGLVVPRRDTVKASAFDRRFDLIIVERQIRSKGHGQRIQVGLDKLLVNKDAWDCACVITTPNWFEWHAREARLV